MTIPDGVTTIGESAFSGCKSLTNVVIPKSVTNIGMDAFDSTPWLEAQGSKAFVIVGNGVLIQYNGSDRNVMIPQDVTSIGGGAFFKCRDLTTVTIPNGVTSVGRYAFYGCNNLTSVVIPDGAVSIGEYAFSECHSLTSVSIPDSVTVIGENMFGERVQVIRGENPYSWQEKQAIHGVPGSYAETYATQNGILFIAD